MTDRQTDGQTKLRLTRPR